MDLEDCGAADDPVLTDALKGFPFGVRMTLRRLGEQGWNLMRGDLPLPAAVIRQTELDANRAWMRDYVARQGVRLAPHVKTTMSPELIERQLADGAWALAVANLHQLKVCRRLGARRILIANQVVGVPELAALAAELAGDPDLEILLLVDSVATLVRLEEAARAAGLSRRVPVFVELGYPGGRTGCRTPLEARDLARRVSHSGSVRLAGLDLYEGLHQSSEEGAGFERVDALLGTFAALVETLRLEGLLPEPCLLTAGGSAFYPEVVDRLGGLGCELVLRSGCYIVHDHGLYQRWQTQSRRPRVGGPRAALEVWAQVLSRPEPGLVILNAGKRDLGMDAGLPTPVAWAPEGATTPVPIEGWTTLALSDQHAHVALPQEAVAGVGDRVALGISHPCTTMDKWRLVYLVDDAYGVVGGLRTCF